MFGADAIDHDLDGAVKQLDDEDQEHRGDQEHPLDTRLPQIEPERNDDDREQHFLAEGFFFAKRAGETAEAVPEGAQQSLDAARLGLARIRAVRRRGDERLRADARAHAAGFQARSSCLAARTSSSRRTGSVCGASRTLSGSFSASWPMATRASTKASSSSRASVSV